jgi:hypothetical protein
VAACVDVTVSALASATASVLPSFTPRAWTFAPVGTSGASSAKTRQPAVRGVQCELITIVDMIDVVDVQRFVVAELVGVLLDVRRDLRRQLVANAFGNSAFITPFGSL